MSYACLATFSRGVYLAVPISLALLFLLLPSSSERGSPGRVASLVKGALAIAVAAFASYLVFRAGGYRSLLAVLGVLALSLQVSSVARGATLIEWVIATGLGCVLAGLGAVAASMIGKGPYVVYALAFALCLGLLLLRGSADRRAWQIPATLATWLWVAFAAVEVARHWGGDSAQRGAAIVVASAAVIAGSVAVMLGGAYMGDRFATSEQDFEGRIQHWRDGLGLISTPTEWLLGKGLGRFPKSYFFGASDAAIPGSYRVANDEGNAFLVLSGPRHPFSFGELFRLAQRVPIAPGPYTLTFDARAPAPAQLHIGLALEEPVRESATVPR